VLTNVRCLTEGVDIPIVDAIFFSDPKNSLQPMSSVFGFDRGLPIDRYYIESFLEKNKKFIKGHCLEVHDSAYTIKYGEDRVTSYDAVDVDTSNTQANIYADLADAKKHSR
jgi:hypothetical protein